jgi:hypothetical protein
MHDICRVVSYTSTDLCIDFVSNLQFLNNVNRFGGVMVTVQSSGGIDRGFNLSRANQRL